MTDLTDRMRTCAAFIASRPNDAPMPTEHLLDDAADLLIEASNTIEAIPPPLGEPMEIIEPKPPTSSSGHYLPDNHPASPVWIDPGGALPTAKPGARNPRTCPQCDSRANKRVFRDGAKLFLSCPVCAHAWEYQP